MAAKALEDKVFLVTGGARGIGRAIAARLIADGAGAAIVDADRDALDATIAALDRDAPGRAFGMLADVSASETAERAVAEVIARAGRLDGVVNNAGAMIRKPIAELTIDEWRKALATNLTPTFLFAKAAEAALRDARGAIVSIASTRAAMSEPDTEAYAATKAGLVGLTHALAVSLGPAVRVNAISPGWIFTGAQDEGAGEDADDADDAGAPPSAADHAWHPAGRVGQPEDVAEMTAYLLDNARAGFITGETFTLDGGVSRRMRYP